MKFLFFCCILATNIVWGQNPPQQYYDLINQAMAKYEAKDYKNSALAFSAAFIVNGGKGIADDRYNAACSWALANFPDSAFFNLEWAAIKGSYKNYSHIMTDSDLNSLHNDKRWGPLLEIIKQNKAKAEANLNKQLVLQLEGIEIDDQKYRLQLDSINKKYGPESNEAKSLYKIMNEKDSINQIKVETMLDKHGWLGPDIVGEQGTITVFLVIQHSNLKTQEKYLPMMREAAKNGKLGKGELALLEDRVAMFHGKKQTYGSQLGTDIEHNSLFVWPIENPDDVDKRRSEVGLEPLADYLNRFQVKWELEKYKKELPTYEKKAKIFFELMQKSEKLKLQ